MVLANQSVAKMLHTKKGGVFRVHERPDQESLELLGERLAAIGVQAEPTPENLGTISQMAKSDAVNYLILRSIPRAMYSPERPRTLRSRARALHALHVPDPALRRRPRTPRPAGRRASRGPRRSRSASPKESTGP